MCESFLQSPETNIHNTGDTFISYPSIISVSVWGEQK